MFGRFTKIILYILFFLMILVFWNTQTTKAAVPQIANYYLGPLPVDEDSVNKMSRFNLLILSADQFLTRKDIIDKIKKINPQIILLAYIPSQSYNYRWWPQDVIFKNLKVDDSWWLRDANGKIVSTWPGIYNTDMSQDWSEALIDFVKNTILTTGNWDGIFWDMVDGGISFQNGGNIDLDRNGLRDNSKEADLEWQKRVAYFLQRSQEELKVKYIIINGNSAKIYQPYINGRMYEDFPTPWEFGGNWSEIMKGVEINKQLNKKPQLYIFNGTSKNTGNPANYRHFRFGLVSSLLLDDIFYSFDHGTEDHGQVWWYDEYEVNLGEPLTTYYSVEGKSKFLNSVWRRDFTNGIALINTTQKTYDVNLGAEYEKISGKQDKAVNDGKIVSQIKIGALNAILLLKTFQDLKEIVFINGNFVGFFNYEGKKARNGFFAYEKKFKGGVKIYIGDIDGDGKEEKIVTNFNKMEIYDGNGIKIYNNFPLGTTFRGNLNFAVGYIYPGKEKQILISGDNISQIAVLNYKGEFLIKPFFPLGKNQKGGFSVAIGDIDGNGSGENILGTVNANKSEVIILNQTFSKINKKFFPFGVKDTNGVNVASGDINGNKKDEIIVTPANGAKIVVGVYDNNAKQLNKFNSTDNLSKKGATPATVDVNFDKIKDIAIINL